MSQRPAAVAALLSFALSPFALPAGSARAQGPEAPPAPPPAPTADADVRPARTEPDATPRWRFGASLGVVALPKPISLALHATYDRHWGAVLTAGFLPRFEYFDNSTIGMWGVDAEARWFPWRGTFFVGAGLGYQNTALGYRLFKTDNVGTVSSLHATARVGWLWIFKSGLGLSVDVGLQTPMIVSDLSGTKSVTVRDIYGILKGTPLPNASLFRVGYFF